MGGRVSVPRAADGLSEAAPQAAPRRPIMSSRNINGRTIVAPLAALTMAGLLFVYARTSIRAAKLNAQQRREADGGMISWRHESLRHHGLIERPEEKGVLGELKDAALGKEELKKKPGEAEAAAAGRGRTGPNGPGVPIEEELRKKIARREATTQLRKEEEV